MKRLIFLFPLIILFCSCSSNMYSKSDFILDTYVNIKIFDKNEEILDEALALCRDYERLLSKTINESDVSRINLSDGQPTKVSDDTIFLLNRAKEYSKLSNGLFDVTIYPVSKLWDFKSKNPKIPSDEMLENATKLVDYNNIKIDGNHVTLLGGSKIDLGAIAKGFIADKLKELLISKNVKSAIINLGGNVLLVGDKPNEDNFSIGIRKPFSKNELVGNIYVKDLSVVGSGTYERYFEYNDKIYHHILDVNTGKSIDNELDSVTIITKHSIDADALSTIAFILGYEKGSQLIESLENTEAIFIFKDSSIKFTSGISTTPNEGKIYFEIK